MKSFPGVKHVLVVFAILISGFAGCHAESITSKLKHAVKSMTNKDYRIAAKLDKKEELTAKELDYLFIKKSKGYNVAPVDMASAVTQKWQVTHKNNKLPADYQRFLKNYESAYNKTHSRRIALNKLRRRQVAESLRQQGRTDGSTSARPQEDKASAFSVLYGRHSN